MKAIDLIKKADEKILAKAKQYEASKQVNAKANYKRELEAAIAENCSDKYPYLISNVVCFDEVVKGIVSDLKNSTKAASACTPSTLLATR